LAWRFLSFARPAENDGQGCFVLLQIRGHAKSGFTRNSSPHHAPVPGKPPEQRSNLVPPLDQGFFF
jgi:hypothetical protein